MSTSPISGFKALSKGSPLLRGPLNVQIENTNSFDHIAELNLGLALPKGLPERILRDCSDLKINEIAEKSLFAPISESSNSFSVINTEEFATLRTSLEGISKKRKEEIINPQKNRELKALIEVIIKKASNNFDLIQILKLFAKTPYFNRLDHFILVFNEIRKRNPFLKDYFLSEDTILTQKSIEAIILYLENREKILKQVISCEDVNSLPMIINDLLDSEEKNVIRGYVACNFSEGSHVIPVFVKKYDCKIKIFILDSLGCDIKNYRYDCSKALNNLITYFSAKIKSNIKPDNIEIYSFIPKRQNDGSSCSIFSIVDLTNLVRCHMAGFDIFDFLNEEGNKTWVMPQIQDDSDLQLFTVDTLPQVMMKSTQSMSLIKNYSEKNPRYRSPVFFRKSPYEGRFNQEDSDRMTKAIDKHTCASPSPSFLNKTPPDSPDSSDSSDSLDSPRMQNYYISSKKMKLITFLFEELFKNTSEYTKLFDS